MPEPQGSTCTVIATATPTSPPRGGCGGVPLTAGELRLLLIDELGPLWYCDRDSYPVGRDEQQAALDTYGRDGRGHETCSRRSPQRSGSIRPRPMTRPRSSPSTGSGRSRRPSRSSPIGNDRFRFDYLAQPVGGATEGARTAGHRGHARCDHDRAAGACRRADVPDLPGAGHADRHAGRSGHGGRAPPGRPDLDAGN